MMYSILHVFFPQTDTSHSVLITQAFHNFGCFLLITNVGNTLFCFVQDLVPALGPTRGVCSGVKSKFTADGKRLAWVGTHAITDLTR